MNKYKVFIFLSCGILCAMKKEPVKIGKQEVEEKTPYEHGYYDEDYALESVCRDFKKSKLLHMKKTQEKESYDCKKKCCLILFCIGDQLLNGPCCLNPGYSIT